MTREDSGPSPWGWAFLLLLVLLLAAFFRFYQLGNWPPGLYRDEAFNGLDAQNVLQGSLRLWFPANNGREPLYIYLITIAVALFGSTALAVRLPAAIVGTLTTLPTYLLGREWFGRITGLLAALLWATTFWPVHLSRVGFRVILLAPLLGLAFWLGTRAFRNGRGSWWVMAGAVYGLTFYTYLAARFTPLVLVAVALYLLASGHKTRLWSAGRVLWFVVGAAIILVPLGIVAIGDPGIILGRSGQVSILNPAVNGGDLLGTLWSQTGKALGMFVWRGDTILRHNALLDYTAVLPQDNPQGRPVFDLFMVGPLLIGIGWCLVHWRRPAAATLLLWQIIMLGPTILAEDTPHFLRAAGLLPGLMLLPAIGLNTIWTWPRIPVWLRRGAVVLLLVGSIVTTGRDYATYGREPEVSYLFETAAADLANSAADDTAEAAVFVDQRFWEGWPAISYLLEGTPVRLVGQDEATRATAGSMVRYAWPYESLAAIGESAIAPTLVSANTGPLTRGDLELAAYSLYTRYAFSPGEVPVVRADNFDNRFQLSDATVSPADTADTSENDIEIELTWEMAPGAAVPDVLPSVFVHVLGMDGVAAQSDGPLAEGLWPAALWRPGIAVTDSHKLHLPEPLDPSRHQILVGLYWPDAQKRLPVLNSGYTMVDDQVTIWPSDTQP